MSFNIVKDAAAPKWAWALGPLILLGTIVISFLHPFATPLLAVALIVGGIVACRQSASAVVRALAAAAIAAGTLIILTVILVELSFYCTHTTETVTEGTMTTPIMIKP